jgi:hypothetical protein
VSAATGASFDSDDIAASLLRSERGVPPKPATRSPVAPVRTAALSLPSEPEDPGPAPPPETLEQEITAVGVCVRMRELSVEPPLVGALPGCL